MSPMVTYLVIAVFVVVCLTLVFGYSHLLRLRHALDHAEETAEQLGSAEAGLAAATARRRYNEAVTGFPTNMVARITGFTRAGR